MRYARKEHDPDVDANQQPSVLIAVCTFKRPQLLAGLLRSLQDQRGDVQTRLAVIDNDASGSARDTVARVAPDALYHVVEEPGLAAARNACLDLINEEDSHIAFIDDDEVAHPAWLAAHLKCLQFYGASVSGGPVIAQFPPETPDWVIEGGFGHRRRYRTGYRTELPLSWPATNNAVVATDLLRKRRVRFDARFAFTGGEDSDFFARLLDGAQTDWVWVDKAVVYEEIPTGRLRFGWMFTKELGAGSIHARMNMDGSALSRLHFLLRGGAITLHGVLLMCSHAVRRPRLRYQSVSRVASGLGQLSAAAGLQVRRYKRSLEA